MTDFEKLCSICKGSVELSANGHRSEYMSPAEYLEELRERGDLDEDEEEDRNPEILADMLATGTIYRLEFYPDTPVGCHVLFDARLGRLLSRALALVEPR